MRWVALSVFCVGACSYSPPADGLPATPTDAAPSDTSTDSAVLTDSNVECPGTVHSWFADFSSDPTELDDNDLPGPDWVIRGAPPGSFPDGELAEGIWTPTQEIALDTAPKRDFRGRTLIDVRMRATAGGGDGATLWVNVDFAAGLMAPIYMTLEKEGGNQRFTLHNKSSTSSDVELISLVVNSTDFQVLTLDITPTDSSVRGTFGGAVFGPFPYSRITSNDDRFATVIPFGNTPSEFDYARIETCE